MEDRRERLLNLHRRVAAGDVSAPAEVFLSLHRALTRVLSRWHWTSGITWEDAGDLATDAIVSYLSRPERFDPERSSLFSYLSMVANGDALNLIRSRIIQKKNLSKFVELEAAEGNTTEDDPSVRIDAIRILRANLTRIADDDDDERMLQLMLQGEQDTAEYARALGIANLSLAEQRSIVKQRRDRLEKRLKRLGESL